LPVSRTAAGSRFAGGSVAALRIGVLSLQGAFAEHLASLAGVGAEAVAVRLPRHLRGLDGLVIPGGESTAIGKLMRACGFVEPLRSLAEQAFPIYGTCAGMILLARDIRGDETGEVGENRVGVMDIVVRRNAFGRQVESFEQDVEIPPIGGAPFRGVFIRAPLVVRVGADVRVLCRLPDGRIVGAEQENMLVTAFHPELTPDGRVHSYFLELVARARRSGSYRLRGVPEGGYGASS